MIRGILMSDRPALGCALGTKTVTRRPVIKQISTVCGYVGAFAGIAWPDLEFQNAWTDPGFPDDTGAHHFGYLHVPYRPSVDDQRVYRVRSRVEDGDILYVRETWAPMDLDYKWVDWRGGDDPWPRVAYRADGVPHNGDGRECPPPRWYPNIHMPRWAARTWLRVVDVRAERLHAIDDLDARREGLVCTLHPDQHPNCQCAWGADEFRLLWDDHYFGGPHAWDRNPWVYRWECESIGAPDGMGEHDTFSAPYGVCPKCEQEAVSGFIDWPSQQQPNDSKPVSLECEACGWKFTVTRDGYMPKTQRKKPNG